MVYQLEERFRATTDSKVIVNTNNRQSAYTKLIEVLSESTLQGPPTNIHFLADVISSKRKVFLSKHPYQYKMLTG